MISMLEGSLLVQQFDSSHRFLAQMPASSYFLKVHSFISQRQQLFVHRMYELTFCIYTIFNWWSAITSSDSVYLPSFERVKESEKQQSLGSHFDSQQMALSTGCCCFSGLKQAVVVKAGSIEVSILREPEFPKSSKLFALRETRRMSVSVSEGSRRGFKRAEVDFTNSLRFRFLLLQFIKLGFFSLVLKFSMNVNDRCMKVQMV